jgi:hypothetical protein
LCFFLVVVVVVSDVVADVSGVGAVALAEASDVVVASGAVVVVVVVACPVASGATVLGGIVVVVGAPGTVCPGVTPGVDWAAAGTATANAPPAMATDKSLKYIINSSA